MALGAKGYFGATRHPWACLSFLLPFLLAYELGVLYLGGKNADALRNGADAWLRAALGGAGLKQLWLAPVVLALLFAGWSFFRRKDRPGDLVGLITGMALESLIFALGLWVISKAMVPVMGAFGVRLTCNLSPPEVVGRIVTFLGAGIYEEAVFRLGLFTLLVWILQHSVAPSRLAVLLAGLGSAAVFSGAHHVGPGGEPFDRYVFLFRMIAGAYFAALYHLRGFGVAVGAHNAYDLLVGIHIG
jgi:hypothetical protein